MNPNQHNRVSLSVKMFAAFFGSCVSISCSILCIFPSSVWLFSVTFSLSELFFSRFFVLFENFFFQIRCEAYQAPTVNGRKSVSGE